MEAIREIMTVKDNVLQVVLPEEFNGRQVELIILPIGRNAPDVAEKKVDYWKYYGAMKSGLSVEETDKQLKKLRSEWDRDIV